MYVYSYIHTNMYTRESVGWVALHLRFSGNWFVASMYILCVCTYVAGCSCVFCVYTFIWGCDVCVSDGCIVCVYMCSLIREPEYCCCVYILCVHVSQGVRWYIVCLCIYHRVWYLCAWRVYCVYTCVRSSGNRNVAIVCIMCVWTFLTPYDVSGILTPYDVSGSSPAAQVSVGCQKVPCILGHNIVNIFWHPVTYQEEPLQRSCV